MAGEKNQCIMFGRCEKNSEKKSEILDVKNNRLREGTPLKI